MLTYYPVLSCLYCQLAVLSGLVGGLSSAWLDHEPDQVPDFSSSRAACFIVCGKPGQVRHTGRGRTHIAYYTSPRASGAYIDVTSWVLDSISTQGP